MRMLLRDKEATTQDVCFQCSTVAMSYSGGDGWNKGLKEVREFYSFGFVYTAGATMHILLVQKNKLNHSVLPSNDSLHCVALITQGVAEPDWLKNFLFFFNQIMLNSCSLLNIYVVHIYNG